MKRFSLRLPDTLHERLLEIANQEKRSLNNLILYLLEKQCQEQKSANNVEKNS